MGNISRKRLLATLAVSLAVHAGIVFAPSARPVTATRAEFSRPKITQEVMHEEPVRPEAEEKKPQVDVQALKEDQRRFVEKTLESVKRGEHIPLSDFLIESQLLDWNIKAAENGEQRLELGDMKAAYRKLVDRARDYADGEDNEVEALHEFLHGRVLSTYYFGDDSIIHVLTKNWYQCTSATEMFSAMLEDVLGKNPEIIIFDNHIKSRVNGKAIENTSHIWEEAVTRYDGCGILAPRDVFFVAYLLAHDVPEEEIPKRLMHPYHPRTPPAHCSQEGPVPPSDRDSLGGLNFPESGVFSDGNIPLHPVSNDAFHTPANDVVAMARVLLAAHRLIQPEEGTEAVAADAAAQNNIFADAVEIPRGVNWRRLFEVYYGSIYEALPTLAISQERMRGQFFGLLPPAEIVARIAEIAVNSGDAEAKICTRESFCGKVAEAIESRTINTSGRYSFIAFCSELNGPLRRLYKSQRDPLVLDVIGVLGLRENFDFLLGETASSDMQIRETAMWHLLHADKIRACEALRQRWDRRTSQYGVGNLDAYDMLRESLVYECADAEVLWEVVSRIPLEVPLKLFVANAITDGKKLTRAQYDLLRNLGTREGIETAVKLSLGRIFYEYGETEVAREFFQRGVEELEDDGCEHPLYIPYGIPLEFLPLLNGVVQNAGCSLEIAKSLEDTPEAVYPPKLVRSLRELVLDETGRLGGRVIAAFLLLKHGIDPLGRD